ncbi:PIG-L family deacetylase [Fulvivirga sediminis]|uniref:PIG-L family deacetylase n=1 Tax=Fulvivirga sediminis TaxID=2803949 RepID=A0A937FA08_9BACT|nr:PIG-L family deacetylase [Fulvivirga sediminis]MBL3659046.1 PIG-L family deacetylase [Fulvivirga sediminis]
MIKKYINNRKLTFLSPHYDDIAFSLAGLMPLILENVDTCELINVFSNSNFIYERVSHIKLSTHLRKNEDEIAMSSLGPIDLKYAGFDEALVRNNKRSSLFIQGPKHLKKTDLLLISDLTNFLLKVPEDRIMFIPAGFGGHTDHIILHEAAKPLPHCKIYYSDLPYATDDILYINQYGIRSTQTKKKISVRVTSTMISLHLQVCKMYKTQFREMFADPISKFLKINGYQLWM